MAIGLGLTSVASIGYAGVFAKRHAGSYDPIMLTGLQFGFGAVWLTTAMLFIEGLPTGLSADGWWLIFFLAIAATFMPFLLYYWLIQYISATEGSLVGYLSPFVGLIGGILLLDEKLQRGIVIGGVLVFAGMILSDREGHKASAFAHTHGR